MACADAGAMPTQVCPGGATVTPPSRTCAKEQPMAMRPTARGSVLLAFLFSATCPLTWAQDTTSNRAASAVASDANSVRAWTSGGPYGGNIHALAIDPTSPATLYAGTFDGGVFKSTDSGGTWAAANTGLTSGLTYVYVLALTIAPTSSRTLYDSSTGAGVNRSTASRCIADYTN